MYKSVDDYDVLRGIFSSRIGAQSYTKDALEAEARGDYAKALKLYSDVRNLPASLILYGSISLTLKQEEKISWLTPTVQSTRKL